MNKEEIDNVDTIDELLSIISVLLNADKVKPNNDGREELTLSLDEVYILQKALITVVKEVRVSSKDKANAVHDDFLEELSQPLSGTKTVNSGVGGSATTPWTINPPDTNNIWYWTGDLAHKTSTGTLGTVPKKI